MKIGYHASHEQFAPSELIRLVQAAQDNGFESVLSSDHFHPWSRAQGQSGFAWSWLGAALQATRLQFGVVNTPGWRYHPAIIAQAAATLAEMFPERFWLAIGSGELLNEAITGVHWPPKDIRNQVLEESARIIRDLWAGKTVTQYGYNTLEEAKLYTRPQSPPLLIGAAITPETARFVGGWADGMITISHRLERLRQVVNAFREGGGAAKPIYLKVQLSYDPSGDEALYDAWRQWRTNVFGSVLMPELRTPAQFEAAAEDVTPSDMSPAVLISRDTEQFAEWLSEYAALGFEQIILHNVNRGQRRFIEDFGRKVLPALIQVAT
jgi:coenzyme F420-dependent glucose-6-phosphate dehydrogenase